jgi:carboxyl-terminal processing protease
VTSESPASRTSSIRTSSVVLFTSLLVAMSAMFFAGGYLFGHLDGRTGNGPLSRSRLVAAPPAPAQLSEEDQQRFKVLWEALGEIERSYYQRSSLDREQLAQGAVRGLVEAVGDPYTTYVTPRHREFSDAELHGSIDGIGVQVDLREGQLRVVAPLEGSPGEQAGLRPGDVITQVNGQDISRVGLDDAVAMIRGPRGTTVTLTVTREGEPAPLTFAIVRSEIKLELVRSRMLDEHQIGYVRVTSFSEPTASQLRQQLQSLLDAKPRAIVLDLRSNPGGYLSSAVEVTGQFLRDGVVLYQHGEADGEPKEIRTSGTAQVPDLPLAVLVDRGSASAAEVVAAALRDNQRAILVGEKTFGKGTVQELHNLSDNSQLRITIAQWLTPGGLPIQGEGLVPDIVVQSPDDRDAALDAAVQYLSTEGATARG